MGQSYQLRLASSLACTPQPPRKPGLFVHLGDDARPAQDVFEDNESVHLVMELCEGGALLERIERLKYSEAYIARLTRSILRFVSQCHAKGIIYRDIKVCGRAILPNTLRAWGQLGVCMLLFEVTASGTHGLRLRLVVVLTCHEQHSCPLPNCVHVIHHALTNHVFFLPLLPSPA
jgi:hypothetical protein